MKSSRHLAATVIIAVVVVVADQIAKSAVTARIEPGHAVDVIGPLRFTLTYNDGIAFGLAGGKGVLVILLAAVALVALGAFIATAPARWPTAVAGGLILGGAAGNLIDRFRLGHVTDFILLPSWPAFNLADTAITIGVIVLAWWLITEGARSEPDPPKESAGSSRPDRTGTPAARPAGEGSQAAGPEARSKAESPVAGPDGDPSVTGPDPDTSGIDR